MGSINREAALRRLEGDEELYSEIIAIYLADTPVQIAKLEHAVETGDMETALRQAHSIKSASGNVGADLVRQIAAEIETCRREGDIEVLHDLTKQLRVVFNQAEADLQHPCV